MHSWVSLRKNDHIPSYHSTHYCGRSIKFRNNWKHESPVEPARSHRLCEDRSTFFYQRCSRIGYESERRTFSYVLAPLEPGCVLQHLLPWSYDGSLFPNYRRSGYLVPAIANSPQTYASQSKHVTSSTSRPTPNRRCVLERCRKSHKPAVARHGSSSNKHDS
jgi:hypothetical protein